MTCRGAVSGAALQLFPATWALDRLTAIRGALRATWSTRSERLWLGLVAVPLAEVAAGLLGLWWMWVPLLLFAWACTRSWRWLWVLSFELGFIGVAWAALGISALAQFPDELVLIGAGWTAFPLALAAAGVISRRRSVHR
jgi:hypothetical protein